MDEGIVVVGAGPAGLSTAGALVTRGLDPLVLEKDGRIGDGWRRRYDRLHLHTIRAFSGLAHYPVPPRCPRYVPRDLFAAYLEEYAAHFRLRVRPSTAVTRVAPAADGAGGWVVEAGPQRVRARVIVVATGHFAIPRRPAWIGEVAFAGQILHAADYRNGRAFAGRRVLVVGAGNSGTEIATDLADHGARVSVAIRSGVFLVRRDWLGTPVQLFGMVLSPLPPAVADAIGRVLARISVGDLGRYGLKPPRRDQLPFAGRHVPIIDVGFLEALERGRVTLRGDVARLTPGGVVFADGREEPFDALIAATGYRTGLDRLLDAPDALDQTGYPRYPSGGPTPYAGLFFMGFTQSVRGHLFEMNRDSRRLAARLARG